jgi:tetratricopeptide (TPR) repeat protein
VKLLNDSVEIYQKTGNERRKTSSIFVLGDLAILQNDLKSGRQQIERALKGRELSQVVFADAARIYANLLYEEGKVAEAEKLARREAANEKGLAAERSILWEMVARCLLRKGRITESKEAIEQAKKLFPMGTYETWRLSVQITEARVHAASGDPAAVRQAIATLEKLISRTEEISQVYRHFEARLALGQIELAYGDAERGRKTLTKLQTEAAAKGFHLLAAKAASSQF